MEGTTIVDENGTQEPIAETMERLLEELAPVFEKLGSAEQVPVIMGMVRGQPSYARQRAVFEPTGNTKDVVDALVREGEENRIAGT